jgi:hypothetical protein
MTQSILKTEAILFPSHDLAGEMTEEDLDDILGVADLDDEEDEENDEQDISI